MKYTDIIPVITAEDAAEYGVPFYTEVFEYIGDIALPYLESNEEYIYLELNRYYHIFLEFTDYIISKYTENILLGEEIDNATLLKYQRVIELRRIARQEISNYEDIHNLNSSEAREHRYNQLIQQNVPIEAYDIFEETNEQ